MPVVTNFVERTSHGSFEGKRETAVRGSKGVVVGRCLGTNKKGSRGGWRIKCAGAAE
jgi:hypothetical protein